MSIYFPFEYTSPRPLHQKQSALVSGRTSEPIPFGHVVLWDGSKFGLADPSDGLFSGVNVRRSAGIDEEIEVLATGMVESEDWTEPTGEKLLTPGRSYFLRAGGALGSPPDAGVLVRVGIAVSETVLSVAFDLKVVL